MATKPTGDRSKGSGGSGNSVFVDNTVERLAELSRALHDTRFILPAQDASQGAEFLRRQTIDQIADYLIPRLKNLHAPLLAVIGGSTGSGKSTLINSLIQDNISLAGAVRPTTRVPVLAYNPADEHWFSDERVLPELQRLKASGDSSQSSFRDMTGLLLTSHHKVPEGIAIIDAPDIDSISTQNRQLASQLLNAADLWIFVTTANRYADALPWDLLTEAGARNITVSVVLNRVPAGAQEQIVPDLTRLLAERNLDAKLLHVINETTLDSHGRLAASAVSSLQSWITSLADNEKERQRIAAQTLDGALKRTAADASELLAELTQQQLALKELQAHVDQRFAYAVERTDKALADGSLLRGEILSRWQDFVGAGELLHGIEGAVGRVRDRVGSFFTGKPPASQRVEQAIESGLHTVFVSEITSAFQDIDRTWQNSPVGNALLDELSAPRPDDNLSDRAAEAIRHWQREVLDMIRAEGAGKRRTARMAAFGVNGIAVVLMVVVFASTAGLTGIELGIAGGSAIVGQKLLEAIFGEDAVRRMAARAKRMLQTQAESLMNDYSQTYTQHIDSHEQPQALASLEAFVASQGKKGRRQ